MSLSLVPDFPEVIHYFCREKKNKTKQKQPNKQKNIFYSKCAFGKMCIGQFKCMHNVCTYKLEWIVTRPLQISAQHTSVLWMPFKWNLPAPGLHATHFLHKELDKYLAIWHLHKKCNFDSIKISNFSSLWTMFNMPYPVALLKSYSTQCVRKIRVSISTAKIGYLTFFFSNYFQVQCWGKIIFNNQTEYKIFSFNIFFHRIGLYAYCIYP